MKFIAATVLSAATLVVAIPVGHLYIHVYMSSTH